MFVDFTPSNEWLNLNHYMEENLSFDRTQGSICVYKNISHALREICFGLMKLFPHKKNIYYFKNTNPYIDSLIKDLRLENSLNIRPLDLKILNSSEVFFESLSSEDLFLLYAKDDPFLGKVFEMDSFVKVFNEKSLVKKCFLVSISHSVHFYDLLKWEADHFLKKKQRPSFYFVGPYNIDIYSYGKKGAFSCLGLRSKKIESLLASKLFWSRKDYNRMKTFFKSHFKIEHKKKEDKKNDLFEIFNERRLRILDFERQKPGGFQRFFLEDQKRTFDRAVFYWEDMDGSAFIEWLAKKLGFSLLQPGDEMRLETTSLTRWKGFRTMDWLKGFGLSENQIRGLVLIDVSLITGDLLDLIRETRKKILSLQG